MHPRLQKLSQGELESETNVTNLDYTVGPLKEERERRGERSGILLLVTCFAAGPQLGIHLHLGKQIISEDDFLCLKSFDFCHGHWLMGLSWMKREGSVPARSSVCVVS